MTEHYRAPIGLSVILALGLGAAGCGGMKEAMGIIEDVDDTFYTSCMFHPGKSLRYDFDNTDGKDSIAIGDAVVDNTGPVWQDKWTVRSPAGGILTADGDGQSRTYTYDEIRDNRNGVAIATSTYAVIAFEANGTVEHRVAITYTCSSQSRAFPES